MLDSSEIGSRAKFHPIIIIGSGAAGLNCALQMVYCGIKPKDILILTEKLGGGCSFDTGSDKQTYYKMSIIGDAMDSPMDMAHSLFDGGAMHGDIAFIEAANSLRGFFHLVSLGVPFPHDEYGNYVGYKTDNDPKQRATSVGPLTSRFMGKKLLDAVRLHNIEILDGHYVSDILETDDGKLLGIMGFRISDENINQSTFLYECNYLVVAVGGPSAVYQSSVYPPSQWGCSSLGLKAGLKYQNLTESQFGIASTKFRWNLSGTYQQVIPRYFSVPNNVDISNIDIMTEGVEFLKEYFLDFTNLSRAVFLKGYQWPFNSERIENYGSSVIDLAVYQENQKGRTVYLDYMNNPSEYDFDKLDPLVKEYLNNSEAMQETPIGRLEHMNLKAIEIYKDHGISLYHEPLEIAICAQHMNGGIVGDMWWETNVKNIFAIGEINGSHGVHRPGGSALNSGQVGAIRAAEKISFYYSHEELSNGETRKAFLIEKAKQQLETYKKIWVGSNPENKQSLDAILEDIRTRMNETGAHIRMKNKISQAVSDAILLSSNFFEIVSLSDNQIKSSNFVKVLKVYDAVLTHAAILKAIDDYIQNGGGSRSSYIIIDDSPKAISPHEKLKKYAFLRDNYELRGKIFELQARISDKEVLFSREIVPTRPLPKIDAWFETTWKKYDSGEIFK
jgi:succinate dehydrogenase/fumarate reductase flavoprotein subunit